MFGRLARELAERGHRVLTVSDKNEPGPTFGDRHVALSWPSPRPVRLADARFLWRLLGQERPELVVANFGAVTLVTLVGWLRRVPVRVCWVRTLSSQLALDSGYGRTWHDRLLHQRRAWVYRAATHLVANSMATADDVQRTYGIPARKLTVISNLLGDRREALASSATPDTECRRFVCVGRLDRSKGQDTLVRAVALLADDGVDATVDFIGGGAQRDLLEGLAVELGVAGRCRFLGNLDHDGVLRSMRSALATVVPSRSEAFGWVVVESFSMGTPVVGTRTGGIPEVVTDNVDGLLVAVDDPVALAGALSELLEHPDRRRLLATHARRKFESTYSLDVRAGGVADLLLSLV